METTEITIKYNTSEDPKYVGVYACRIPHNSSLLLEDKFLMWIDNKWWYPGSDQKYRGEVLGWIGPLQRKI
jgi:hypothetical protein